MLPPATKRQQDSVKSLKSSLKRSVSMPTAREARFARADGAPRGWQTTGAKYVGKDAVRVHAAKKPHTGQFIIYFLQAPMLVPVSFVSVFFRLFFAPPRTVLLNTPKTTNCLYRSKSNNNVQARRRPKIPGAFQCTSGHFRSQVSSESSKTGSYEANKPKIYNKKWVLFMYIRPTAAVCACFFHWNNYLI